MEKGFLNPLFLGPYGENNDLFEKVLLEFLRDHVYWRRNFHPEDPPAIPTLAASDPEYLRFVAGMTRELHALSAALKRSVPFSSPRYIGHMASDTLLPALIAQLMTVPYNPNNVVDEAAPVTLDLEISAGLQLARMLGYEHDESRENCAFGHLTGGGTVANYESLHLLRSLRHFPLALRAALGGSGHTLITNGNDIAQMDDWLLFNLPVDAVIELHARWLELLRALPPAEAHALRAALQAEKLDTLGWQAFGERHPDWRTPLVFVPVTAHYSWAKGMKLIGLGEAQLVEIPEAGMRMDVGALRDRLEAARATRRPVLAIVGVVGTTEFGTIDPIADIADLRDEFSATGLYAVLHIDAAWGGYLTSLFREANGSLADYETVRSEYRHFPSRMVYESFAALPRAESVTVDPHKLGFVPFGAGAIIFRDQRMLDFVAQSADYVFDPARDAPDYRAKFRQLGRYILEGSKPGAAAAAVYVSQRVLPPDRDHLGRVIRESLHSTEYFYDRVPALAEELADVARLIVPFDPDSNLITLAINPKDNTKLAELNRFARRVFGAMKVDPAQPVQTREFFGSYTTLTRSGLGETEFQAILERLGITDTGTEDRIFILRHTLMNPWLIDSRNGVNYIDRYFEFLARTVRAAASASIPDRR